MLLTEEIEALKIDSETKSMIIMSLQEEHKSTHFDSEPKQLNGEIQNLKKQLQDFQK